MTLKELRLQAGLTQNQLAELSNSNIRDIRYYEAGKRKIKNMTLEKAVLIAKALNVTPEELLLLQDIEN